MATQSPDPEVQIRINKECEADQQLGQDNITTDTVPNNDMPHLSKCSQPSHTCRPRTNK